MANNGGRQAGGGGNGQMNEHVEFTVKAEEDLYLTGSENTIRRVTAETNYSCLMLKTQRFSSLFRHYAKYHGLRKDDLEYYFVNPLENEDTPETVHLQRGDTIMVRKRRKPEPAEPAADDDEFFKDMRELFEDEEHMDCTFMVHSENNNNNKKRKDDAMDEDETDDTKKTDSMVEIRAHKCILTARAEYFKAFFRKGYTNNNTNGGNNNNTNTATTTFREAEECVIHVEPDFAPCHIRYMMEFIYTNRIQSIKEISTDDLLALLHLSDRWLIRDLKRLVEHELIRNHMTIQSVARMYGATEDFHANRLSRACIDFIMDNLRQLAGNSSFEEEMKNYPHLCIPVLKAAAEMIPEGPLHKKQRTDHGSSTTAAATPSSNAAAGLGSSPVPDSDP
ncbi:meprin and TRAF homology domain-containing protein MATH domain-containing protein [Seminavis robusta]|uniref:Meprin and TRAF homology domain-containing protein MATH domain-containing protein n=1 Tax=Seminavis robusta TaxID=568900 RepID=A0A9N8DF44_9STRA|nr:meprin and TRAF homology domain-containing protein MATH domain-containing protein [Seminavis robusta]|eukprot:Sro94_g048980.1 meprin and TRAF homology domain-containing protein MATH domain-containing protein (392) ;mRNA; f:52946-54330